MMAAPRCFIVLLFAFVLFSTEVKALSSNYYDQTCPNAEATITKVVKKAMLNDKTVPAALLRMHFHDCFVRGCDGSVLLNSTRNNKAEKDGPPNISLHAFYVIDVVKKQIEDLCPGVVSCADIVALAARDAVALSGGPTWAVPKGRKDGRISKATETRQLPSPTFNMSQLQQNFAQRGLSLDDLVALSGGHTLGFSHCSSFQNRIHKFDKSHNVDPSLQASFAASLLNVCPAHNKVRNAGATMDSTTTLFDNAYYKLLMNGKGLFSSDEALLTNSRTKRLVSKYASSQDEFFKAFASSMIKMSSISGELSFDTACMTFCLVAVVHDRSKMSRRRSLCPGVVSCADIVALAARDAVALSGGPTWEVPKGRKDGRISKATETRQLPSPTFNMSQLQQNFAQRGLSLDDLVALSGGHTLGFSHCSSFQNRIHKFDKSHNVDPSLQASFAASLLNVCTAHNKVRNAGATMDSTTTLFDNAYYMLLMNGKGLFSSDEALLTNARTKRLVSKYASSQDAFFKAFANSMIKMSSISGNGQEVRLELQIC
ncbi:Peroxidase 64 [Capsicum annuum]|nr:Peroxidase 64 [Capsicum annuum]